MTEGAVTDSAEHVIRAWMQAAIGGTVTAVVRQPRWRPVWFVEVDRDGEQLELCVRGTRQDTDLVFPLDHEMRFQAVLAEAGLPVPGVHGWIDALPAYVMDRVPGRPDFTGAPPAERDAVVDQYLHSLAALHALDLRPFADARIDRAADPEASGLLGLRRFEALYRKQKQGPDPFLEFSLGWLRRNPPRSRGREAPVVWDSGQFHHTGGRLVALLDLELGHIGDPMMDLAGWRMRDSVMSYGDFTALYRRYEELTGTEVDLEAVRRHHVVFTLTNQLSFAHTLRNPPPATDFATNLQWCNETNLYATEALAEELGVELPTVAGVEPRDSRVAPAHEHLVRTLRAVSTDDPLLRAQLRGAFRLASHLKRVDEIGDATTAADVDDICALLGRSVAGWREAEDELERFVLADAARGRHDVELVQLFHRRHLRAQSLNGPAGSAMARHIPLQRFDAAEPERAGGL